MKVFIYSLTILLVLACGVRKSSRRQSISKDSLALNVQTNLRDSSSLSEITHELDHVNAALYQISVISQQPFQWHPDSGVRLDGGQLVISRLRQNRRIKQTTDKREQRVIGADQQVMVDFKHSKQELFSQNKRWIDFKWFAAGVLLAVVLGCWWLRRRR